VVHPKPSGLRQRGESGVCRETEGAWLSGELEAKGAGLMPVNTQGGGESQGGELFMSTQEQCWHKNERVETSKNKLRLET